ncbi:right-handed parallel beta-helix repeat-containing protein [Compostimonas suwonensis]|uniref:Nitrous oxidase accessory protein NosD n=1 Tax=Compostimonas suwonensis TaxID=1048394 RepID=A0A2M9C4G8_9MICO|nr:NosD domain-containing protein [Compostimonas suwonensis]PJJ65424.1 nitrous oxidase accessory protein NosD [Compostimonas suwonensis]
MPALRRRTAAFDARAGTPRSVPPCGAARTRPGVVASLAGAALALVLLVSGCAPGGTAEPSASRAASAGPGALTIRVPADAPTITEAAERVAEGGLILVSPGTYAESVLIDTPDVTLRGTDRNTVIIDGEGLRANGVQVIADGVRVENLTVRNHTFNGVLVTGMHDDNGPQAHNLDGYTKLDPQKFPPLERFSVSHVTASNNGLYGIYAFNSHDGVISDNYSSGSADSGFYVGQCQGCGILVSGNIAENNAIGYENANASDSVVVTGNRFSGNRVGATLISSYQEAFLPQQKVSFVGNVVTGNSSETSPAQAQGAFGLGIGIAGGHENLVSNNLISGNPAAGVQITNTEDIPAVGNRIVGNTFGGNGVDVADVAAARSSTTGTCVDPAAGLTLLPPALAAGCGTDAPSTGADPAQLPALAVPRGMSFLKVPAGPEQPSLDGDLTTVPPRLPASVTMPDLAAIPVPDAGLLASAGRR